MVDYWGDAEYDEGDFPDRQYYQDYYIDRATEALRKKPTLEFTIIAETSLGRVFAVTRKKGEVKLGRVMKEGKEWRFTPNFGIRLTSDELYEIGSLLDGEAL